MSHNTFGHLFRVTTWGESHGPAIGCVVDGCPPGLPLTGRGHPGLPRQAPARPVALHHPAARARHGAHPVRRVRGRGRPAGHHRHTDLARSSTTSTSAGATTTEIKDKFRPGHADFTYWEKYGIRDYRGGGRASARETATRVAAGAVARKVIPEVTVRGALVQIGRHKIDRSRWSWDEVDKNPFFCPDPGIVETWSGYLDEVRKAGSSVGAVIEVVAEGVPAGWGAPHLRQARPGPGRGSS